MNGVTAKFVVAVSIPKRLLVEGDGAAVSGANTSSSQPGQSRPRLQVLQLVANPTLA
jgi:hypothetical protein